MCADVVVAALDDRNRLGEHHAAPRAHAKLRDGAAGNDARIFAVFVRFPNAHLVGRGRRSGEGEDGHRSDTRTLVGGEVGGGETLHEVHGIYALDIQLRVVGLIGRDVDARQAVAERPAQRVGSR